MAGVWDVVADALGFGPSGNDHGSSNWAAWGHEEICSMLDTSVNQWAATMADTAEHHHADGRLGVGCRAGQGRGAPPKSFDWGEALGSYAIGSGIGAFTDAVVQEQQKADAHAEAARIMTTVYSVPTTTAPRCRPTLS